jgi:hypothetical protein
MGFSGAADGDETSGVVLSGKEVKTDYYWPG